MADKLYFATKAIIIKDDTFLALYSMRGDHKSWDLPGGRMSIGEDAETTLVREVDEETGLKIRPLKLIDTWNYVRDAEYHVTGVFYQCECDSFDVQLSDEHDGYEWLNINDYTEYLKSRPYLERMMNWDWQSLESGYDVTAHKVELLEINNLRPNNLYLSSSKVDKIEVAYQVGKTYYLPPILVANIDGELAIVDGHSRVYAAYKNNFTTINAFVKPIDKVQGPEALYRTIHSMAKKENIHTIGDLENKILDDAEHEKKWIGLCKQLMNEIED